MDYMILSIVVAVVTACIGAVWGIDWLTRRRRGHFRDLERQNMALRAHLEVARAKMRQLNSRRVS